MSEQLVERLEVGTPTVSLCVAVSGYAFPDERGTFAANLLLASVELEGHGAEGDEHVARVPRTAIPAAAFDRLAAGLCDGGDGPLTLEDVGGLLALELEEVPAGRRLTGYVGRDPALAQWFQVVLDAEQVAELAAAAAVVVDRWPERHAGGRDDFDACVDGVSALLDAWDPMSAGIDPPGEYEEQASEIVARLVATGADAAGAATIAREVLEHWFEMPLPDDSGLARFAAEAVQLAGALRGEAADRRSVGVVADDWYAVLCVLRYADRYDADAYLYEERITLWRAGGFAEAIELAEAGVRQYCADTDGEYAGYAAAFRAMDPPGHGQEVHSVMRDSELEAQAYLDRFVDTGSERRGDVADDRPGVSAMTAALRVVPETCSHPDAGR